MVRVLSCHHFAAQDVFSPQHTPLAMCTSRTHLFVATSHCYLEVHDLTKPGCPQQYRLPTVSPVRALVYCRADDYVATIEGEDEESVLRIYLNWQADLSKYPMRVRVAGNMKSLRYSMHDNDSARRLQAVEVPLKSSPVCIAADEHTGNLAVGFHKTVLIYGLCCKREANTDIIYEDFKCLLELQFSFKVREVAICEEFVLAVSVREFQVVKLNLDQIPVTISKNLSLDMEDLAARLEKQRCFKKRQKPVKKNQPCIPEKEPLLQRIRRNTFKKKEAKTPPAPYIVEDKHFFTLDVDDITSSAESRETGESNMKQRIWLDSIKRTVEEESERKRSTSLSDEVEILGLVGTEDCCQKCWAVSVEYEDHCDCNEGPAGALDRGVSTCIYRRLNFSTQLMHSPHLMPIYTKATSSCEDDGDCLEDPGWGTFTSSHRDRLVSLSCYVSTDRQGFLYDVLPDKVQMMATYPYTGPVSEVHMEGDLLYALSPNGIEIYTMRCQARASASIWPPDSSDFSISSKLLKLEPCVIGLQPFIGLQFMAVTQTHLALFSMQEDSWSIYVLQKPGIDMLHTDIRELATAYKASSTAAYSQLVQEAYLLAWSHSCFDPTNSTLEALLSMSCLDLAPLCASGCIGKPEQTIDLYLQSKCTLDQLLDQVDLSDDLLDQPAIMIYLEWILSATKEVIDCSQSTADRIVSLFSTHKPSKLTSIILGSAFVKYSPEHTLNTLKKLIGRETPDQLQVISMVCLHLSVGNQGEAEALLSTLSKGEIVAVCSEYISCVIRSGSELTPLGQLLRRHKADTFVSLLILFYCKGIKQNNEITEILQSNGMSYNWHLEGYLEGILMESCTESSEQIASQLSSMYMAQLKMVSEHCSHLTSSREQYVHTPKALISSKGAFATRFCWLDQLHPFTGTETVPAVPVSAFEGRCPSPLSSSPGVRKSLPTNAVSPSRICYKCTMHLIKIQSLLCSSKLPLSFYSSFLHDLNDCYSTVGGQESLWLLCQLKLEPKVALDRIIDDHPTVLATFLQESFPVHMLEEWKYATESVLQLTQQLSADTMPELHGTYTSVLTDVLLSISRLIPPDQLIALIPRDTNGEFFSRFVQTSTECDQLRKLKEAIMAQSVLLKSP